MKIKSIKKISPELYLVTYLTRWLKREVERWVIAEAGTRKVHEDPPAESDSTLFELFYVFFFRDSDEYADDCWHQIEWMIRNDVDFFDNSKGPDPDWPRPDKIWCEDCQSWHHPVEYCNPRTADPYPNVDLVGVPNKPTPAPPIPVAGSEKEMILKALERNSYKIGITAKDLRISPNTLYQKRKKYGIS